MPRNRTVVNRRAVATFLKSAGTRALIERKTEAVERAATSAGGRYRSDVQTGDRRVRGAVIGDYSTDDPAVSRAALLAALDAARATD